MPRPGCFKDEIIPIIVNCCLKIEEAFYEAAVTLIAKPDYRALPIMNRDTNILNNIYEGLRLSRIYPRNA